MYRQYTSSYITNHIKNNGKDSHFQELIRNFALTIKIVYEEKYYNYIGEVINAWKK